MQLGPGNNSKILSKHSAVQTAVVIIISYKLLSGLNFARYTEQYGSYVPSSPLGVYKPLLLSIHQINFVY